VTTFAGSYPSKTAWQLQLDVTEGTLDAVNNRSFVNWALYIYRGNTDQPFNNAATGFDVSAPGGVSSSFGAYRFGSTGSGTNYSGTPVGGRVLIASGGDWVTHNPDGTGSVNVSADHAAAATLGTATLSGTFALTTLTQAPGTPTALSATYVTDTQINLAWTNNYATNGVPTTSKVQSSVNGAAFGVVATLSATSSASMASAANRKTVFKVDAENSAGASAYSATATVFTTPAAPTSVAAAKDGSGNIIVTWTDNVPFAEHVHVVQAASSSDGGVTWSAWSTLTSTGSGGTYTHASPNPSLQWKYRVSAKNTDTGALSSAQITSNVVVLLTAPNKPTLPALGPYVDKAAAFVVPWTHNSADTTGQTAYEFGYSTNGGTTWSSTGKVTSATSSKTIAASTYAANVVLTIRVRTWGSATTGGSDGTGASPWSDTAAVTFKTRPVVTITSPANSSTYTQSALTVALGFSQAESATFVSATIQLYLGATLLEQVVSTTLAGTLLATPVANGSSYSVKVTVLDSNGLTSDLVTSTFSVAYTRPVPAVVAATYLSDSGIGQLALTIAAPGAGQVAAVAVTITRTIDGETETVVSAYPAASSLTILDMTPTINGDNLYKVTTVAASGATSETDVTMTTAEDEWAFMSKGDVFDQIVQFSGDLKPQASPSVDSTLVKASGRARPIGLYATTGNLTVTGTGEIVEGLGSSPEEIEAFLLITGRGCYRDPTGRRMFGQINGSVSRDTWNVASFPFTVTETS